MAASCERVIQVGQGRDEDLPGVENRCHSAMVARSVADRQLSAIAWAR